MVKQYILKQELLCFREFLISRLNSISKQPILGPDVEKLDLKARKQLIKRLVLTETFLRSLGEPIEETYTNYTIKVYRSNKSKKVKQKISTLGDS